MYSIKKEEKIKPSIFNVKKEPTLTISQRLQNQILYYHSLIGKTEWSGVLFYKELKGSINDLDNLELYATELYLQDIGSSAYTEYTNDESVVDMFDRVKDGMELRRGHIHTHHSMGAYFSGTDDEELYENAEHYDYYLSLIVDFKGDYCAKISIPAEDSCREITVKNTSIKIKVPTKKEVLSLDVDVSLESDEIDDIRYKEVSKIVAERNKKKFNKTKYNKHSIHNNSMYSNVYDGIEPHVQRSFFEEELIEDVIVENISNESLLGKLIMLDEEYEGTVKNALKETDRAYKKSSEYKQELKEHCEIMAESYDIFLEKFKLDDDPASVEEQIFNMKNYVRKFKNNYKALVTEVLNALDSIKSFQLVD